MARRAPLGAVFRAPTRVGGAVSSFDHMALGLVFKLNILGTDCLHQLGAHFNSLDVGLSGLVDWILEHRELVGDVFANVHEIACTLVGLGVSS